jgi:hypothetical protein
MGAHGSKRRQHDSAVTGVTGNGEVLVPERYVRWLNSGSVRHPASGSSWKASRSSPTTPQLAYVARALEPLRARSLPCPTRGMCAWERDAVIRARVPRLLARARFLLRGVVQVAADMPHMNVPPTVVAAVEKSIAHTIRAVQLCGLVVNESRVPTTVGSEPGARTQYIPRNLLECYSVAAEALKFATEVNCTSLNSLKWCVPRLVWFQ